MELAPSRPVAISSPKLFEGIMRKKKIDFFLDPLSTKNEILEIGSGSSWVGNYLRNNGYKNYLGLDLCKSADIVGDIKQWRSLGLEENSKDVIVAFEVLEHVDCVQECLAMLKPGGKFLVTTPVPHFDWVMWTLESLGLNQKRTSPHENLLYLNSIKGFRKAHVMTKFGLSQWAIFEK